MQRRFDCESCQFMSLLCDRLIEVGNGLLGYSVDTIVQKRLYVNQHPWKCGEQIRHKMYLFSILFAKHYLSWYIKKWFSFFVQLQARELPASEKPTASNRYTHGLIIYKETKTKCRLYRCFIEFMDWRYRVINFFLNRIANKSIST